MAASERDVITPRRTSASARTARLYTWAKKVAYATYVVADPAQRSQVPFKQSWMRRASRWSGGRMYSDPQGRESVRCWRRRQNSDFAALVLTPDDSVVSRAAESAVVRDNVIFELGLFWAHACQRKIQHHTSRRNRAHSQGLSQPPRLTQYPVVDRSGWEVMGRA